MNQTQKRQFTRIRFHREVSLTCDMKTYGPYCIRDLSLSGMFVFGSFHLKEGTKCHVTLFQTGSTSSVILEARAKIIRTDLQGVAIEFISMSFDSYLFLQTSLLYEAEDPLSVSLEFPEDCPFRLTDVTASEAFRQSRVL